MLSGGGRVETGPGGSPGPFFVAGKEVPMLVLSRKLNEKILIGGGEVVVTVVRIEKGKVRIGIEAPAHVVVDRAEVAESRAAAGDRP